MEQKDLEKAVDKIVEDLFTENEEKKPLEKGMEGNPPVSPDSAPAPEASKDETARADFPAQINSFDEKTGKIKDKEFKAVQQPGADQEKTPEANQVPAVGMKKSVEVSAEDYDFLQKAKKAQEEEVMKKARQDQVDMIKSAVSEAMARILKENQELKKSMGETKDMVSKIASQPKQPKAITDVLEPINKSQEAAPAEGVEPMNKAMIQEVANELAKSRDVPEFAIEHAIEVERSFQHPQIPDGYIGDQFAMQALKTALLRKK